MNVGNRDASVQRSKSNADGRSRVQPNSGFNALYKTGATP